MLNRTEKVPRSKIQQKLTNELGINISKYQNNMKTTISDRQQNKKIISFINNLYLYKKQVFNIQLISIQNQQKLMDKDYICGCGKAYGSYPAFSTHRKTKHHNVTIPGTVMPSHQKARRGRPSCDFKKVPEMQVSKKQYYQGLNIIEYGLLDLEEMYKGKILSGPSQQGQINCEDIDSDTDSEDDKQRIQAISTFLRILTNHMQKQSSKTVVSFFKDLIKFGLQTSQLRQIQLYNTYCMNNIKSLVNSEMGINFYIQICLLLSKWLCVMGYSKDILRVKARPAADRAIRVQTIVS